MAKIIRNTDKATGREHHIDIETGDVTEPVWTVEQSDQFNKCVSLTEQIVDRKINLVDETTLHTVAYGLAIFGDKGKNLFDKVTIFQSQFATDHLLEVWKEAGRKATLKNKNRFISLCKAKGLEVKLNEDEGWDYLVKEQGKGAFSILDELSSEQILEIQTYGFIPRNGCYYFADFDFSEKKATLKSKTNFVLRIMYHISRGKENKRVIEIKNIHNRTVTMDVETKQLTSFNSFKELTEGAGNFMVDSSFSGSDLIRIKKKLFEEELPSDQIDMLGWNKTNDFFAFSNGIFTDHFIPVDKHGIVTLHGKNFFIPYHPGTDEYSNQNEKLFCYKPGIVDFNEWAEAYCKSFGNTGMVAILFGIATLFSDHIFHVRRNFPMLFLYGEGGSGKSRVGTYLQYLWGEPQPPLKLSDRANTDKARIRKMAQYVNAMALFEEFINELDPAITKTITGIYDRFGYERSNMSSKYGTETVPINSTAFITGNSYPNDDPLMQRLILIDYNSNVRSEATVEAYNKLTLINRKGLTHITGDLLKHREYFVNHFESEFDKRYAMFKKLSLDQGLTVPDRMCENYAVIIATNEVMRGAGLNLPFHTKSLTDFMLETIKIQADKRDVGSATQRFWDIVQQLASERQIKVNREFSFNGNIISIRWTEIHGMYLEKHQKLYRSPGLGKSTMLQKLRDSGAMVNPVGTKQWDKEYKQAIHKHQFEYDKLGIDLLSVVEHWEAEERKYSTKESQKPDEKVMTGNETVKYHYSGNLEEKASNEAKTDDLPF